MCAEQYVSYLPVCAYKYVCVYSLDVPSAPSIERVEPYSSTALVEFDEPASSGGVPILKYKAEWRIAGQVWTDREYEVEDGKYPTHTHTVITFIQNWKQGRERTR